MGAPAPDRAGPRHGGVSNAALLAGASVLVLVPLGSSRPAAACSGADQVISSPSTPGPIFGTGGDITVDSGASVAGGPTGVYAQNCGIGALSNSGAIDGAAGASGGIGVRAASGQTIDLLSNATSGTISGGGGSSGFSPGGAGGTGVSNAGTVTRLTNSGKIAGGNGGSPFTTIAAGGGGGAAVSNSGTIGTLSNSGAISGGGGGSGSGDGVQGGAGMSNAGVIGILNNSGKILGGSGGRGFNRDGAGGAGGAGVWNAQGATVRSLINKATGTINGGSGASGADIGGAGGAGISSAGTIKTLTNNGAITAGNGDSGQFGGAVGGDGVSNTGAITLLTNRGAITGGNGGFIVPGGSGVWNGGRIGTLTNSGAITGGNDGFGGSGGAGVSNEHRIGRLINSGEISGGAPTSPYGAAGDAIYSAGANASIGPITNSGKIIGNVEIDDQRIVTVTGGSGNTFGSWTGGAITIGNGDLIFAGGNTFLSDNILANDGLGMATNEGVLQLAGPQSITGSFTQTGAGVLDLAIAGTASGQYGSLEISAAASLGGDLGLDLSSGFSLAVGESFDVLSFNSYSGGFDALSLDGRACAAQAGDAWRCYAQGESWYLTETISGAGLYQQYVNVTAAPPAPEPSTMALLAMGLASLAGWRWRIRAGPGSFGA
jgi:PEP-CTERM motif